MKIAMFHELPAGGARGSVNAIARILKKRHSVDLYIIDEKINDNEKKLFNNFYFYEFVPKRWIGANWRIKLYKDTLEIYNLYELHKKIANDIDTKSYDVVFIHPSRFTQAPFLLRFIKGKKIYYCQETLRIVYESLFDIEPDLGFAKKGYEKIIRRLRKNIDKRNILNADVVLTNSKFTQKNIKSAYGIDSIVSYLGVDTDLFKPSRIKKDIDILFIGGMDDIEGYPLLAEAISRMNKKPKVWRQNSHENWIGDKQLIKLYSRSNIVVCLARNEPFGLIALEAMACGIPVVAVNEGGYTESVIHRKTGYLLRRDSVVLAEKLDFLLSNEIIRIEMGENACKHVVQHWRWDRQIIHLEKLLKRFAGI